MLFYAFKFVFTQPFATSKMWEKTKFLNGIKQVWIQSSTFPWPITISLYNFVYIACLSGTIKTHLGGKI